LGGELAAGLDGSFAGVLAGRLELDPRTLGERLHAELDESFAGTSLYDQIAAQRARPSNLYAADEGARDVARQLITDAGYEPVLVGGLDQARALEDVTWLPVAAMKNGAPVFYRFTVPGEL
jgi:hypothetical protein